MPLETRNSAIAETARVTIRSMIGLAVGRLTVTLIMTYINFIPLIELSIREILDPVIACQLRTLNYMYFKSRLDE